MALFCDYADCLIDILERYPESFGENSTLFGQPLNYLLVKLGFAAIDRPWEWLYQPDEWSDDHLGTWSEWHPSDEPRESKAMPPKSRENLLIRYRELKDLAESYGHWQDSRGTPATAELDREQMLHWAWTIKDALGARMSRPDVSAACEGLVNGLVKAGLLHPDWIPLAKMGMLDGVLEGLKRSSDGFRALAERTEALLLPRSPKVPPISQDMFGRIQIVNAEWLDSKIAELRTAWPDDETHPSDGAYDYVPLDGIPPESRSELMALSKIAERFGVGVKYLHNLMRNGVLRVAKVSRQRYVYDRNSDLVRQSLGKSQKNVSLQKQPRL